MKSKKKCTTVQLEGTDLTRARVCVCVYEDAVVI